ncbi:hypothetical protein TNCV_1402241 [Trichonephila clavipes]|nr:hypothetical protein TNCV_1402241 [Trichonephila clavipes]
MRFRFGEFRPGKAAKSCQAVKSSSCDMRPGILLLEHRIGCTFQPGQNNRLHNLCGVAVRCQTAINVYQRRPVVKHFAIMTGIGLFDARQNKLARSILWVPAVPVESRHSFTDRNEIQP